MNPVTKQRLAECIGVMVVFFAVLGLGISSNCTGASAYTPPKSTKEKEEDYFRAKEERDKAKQKFDDALNGTGR